MISKQIVFTDINTVQIQNHEVPDPAAGQVQVRLVVSSISSGTERANLMGSTTIAWNRPELEKPIYPRYGGYSSAGIIEKVGEGVTKFAPGDKVALFTEVAFAETMPNEYQDCTVEIDISAQAVQVKNNPVPEAGYTTIPGWPAEIEE